MRRLSAPVAIVLVFAAAAFADDKGSEIPESLKSSALAVQVGARVPGEGSDAPWTAREGKITLPGLPVSFKLVGNDLLILVTVTPYVKDADQCIIVAQGQVWIKSENSVKYQNALNTVALRYGEKVLFYPLGVDSKGFAPIHVEITIDKYIPDPSTDSDTDNSRTTPESQIEPGQGGQGK